LLASSAAAPAALVSQISEPQISQPQTSGPQNAPGSGDDQKIVAGEMRARAGELDKVKLPMATEPAFHFKA